MIGAAQIVPGDVLLVQEGDKICADGRILTGTSEVDASTLTGESVSVTRSAGRADTAVPVLEARDLVFPGRRAPGARPRSKSWQPAYTELGRIAGLSERVKPEQSPLERQIRRIAWLIVAAVAAGRPPGGRPESAGTTVRSCVPRASASQKSGPSSRLHRTNGPGRLPASGTKLKMKSEGQAVSAMKTVKDVMSTHPVSVLRTSSFKELAARLREFRVSAFPVLDDDGRVIGVVSEADMLLKEAMDGGRTVLGRILHRKELRKAAGVTAGDLMTSPAVTVVPEDTVEHAAQLMYARGLKRLPVIDAAGHLVGIISRTDVLAVFDRTDEDIRVEITRHVIPRLSEPSFYWVVVKSGIVTMEGTPETVSIGRNVLARARRVQGVVGLRDRLTYPLPPAPAAPGPYF